MVKFWVQWNGLRVADVEGRSLKGQHLLQHTLFCRKTLVLSRFTPFWMENLLLKSFQRAFGEPAFTEKNKLDCCIEEEKSDCVHVSVPWQPPVCLFFLNRKTQCFDAKTCKYALYESSKGFCCALRKPANPCYPGNDQCFFVKVPLLSLVRISMFLSSKNGIFCFATSMTIVKTSHGAVRMAKDMANTRRSPRPDRDLQRDPRLSRSSWRWNDGNIGVYLIFNGYVVITWVRNLFNS